jgi:hypothetical protein
MPKRPEARLGILLVVPIDIVVPDATKPRMAIVS